MSAKMIKKCQSFREALKSECVAIPGAFNGLVAKSVAENGSFLYLIFLDKSIGFKACYVSGAAVSASAGVPDVG